MIPIVSSIIGAIKGIAGPVKDLVDEFHLSGEEKAQIKLKIDQLALEQERLLMEDDQNFRAFMLQYEGSGADVSPFVQKLRGSVRPIVTYIVILWGCLMMGFPGYFTASVDAVPPKYWDIMMLVLGFWFGGRAVQNILASWKSGKSA